MNTLIITEAVLIIKGEVTVQLCISAVLLRKAGRWDVPYANEKKHILIHTQLDWFEENFKRINDKNERMV